MYCGVLIIFLIITTGNSLNYDRLTRRFLYPVSKNSYENIRLSEEQNVKMGKSIQHPYNLVKTRNDFVKLAEQYIKSYKPYNYKQYKPYNPARKANSSNNEYINILNSLDMLQTLSNLTHSIDNTTKSIDLSSTENPTLKVNVTVVNILPSTKEGLEDKNAYESIISYTESLAIKENLILENILTSTTEGLKENNTNESISSTENSSIIENVMPSATQELSLKKHTESLILSSTESPAGKDNPILANILLSTTEGLKNKNGHIETTVSYLKEIMEYPETTSLNDSDIYDLTDMDTTLNNLIIHTTSSPNIEYFGSEKENFNSQSKSTESEYAIETASTAFGSTTESSTGLRTSTQNYEENASTEWELVRTTSNKEAVDSNFQLTTEKIEPLNIAGFYSTSSKIDVSNYMDVSTAEGSSNSFAAEFTGLNYNDVSTTAKNLISIEPTNLTTKLYENASNMEYYSSDVTTEVNEKTTNMKFEEERYGLTTHSYLKVFSNETDADSSTDTYTVWSQSSTLSPTETTTDKPASEKMYQFSQTATEKIEDLLTTSITSPEETTVTLLDKVPTAESVVKLIESSTKAEFAESILESTTKKLEETTTKPLRETTAEIIETTTEVSKASKHLIINEQLIELSREILGETETKLDEFIIESTTETHSFGSTASSEQMTKIFLPTIEKSTSKSETELEKLTTQTTTNYSEATTKLGFRESTTDIYDYSTVAALKQRTTEAVTQITAIKYLETTSESVESASNMMTNADEYITQSVYNDGTEYNFTTDNSLESTTEAISEVFFANNLQPTKSSIFSENRQNEGINRKAKRLNYDTDVMPSLGGYDLY